MEEWVGDEWEVPVSSKLALIYETYLLLVTTTSRTGRKPFPLVFQGVDGENPMQDPPHPPPSFN